MQRAHRVYPPSAIRRAAGAGLRPARWDKPPAAETAGFHALWLQFVARDETVWGVCQDCAVKVDSFLPKNERSLPPRPLIALVFCGLLGVVGVACFGSLVPLLVGLPVGVGAALWFARRDRAPAPLPPLTRPHPVPSLPQPEATTDGHLKPVALDPARESPLLTLLADALDLAEQDGPPSIGRLASRLDESLRAGPFRALGPHRAVWRAVALAAQEKVEQTLQDRDDHTRVGQLPGSDAPVAMLIHVGAAVWPEDTAAWEREKSFRSPAFPRQIIQKLGVRHLLWVQIFTARAGTGPLGAWGERRLLQGRQHGLTRHEGLSLAVRIGWLNSEPGTTDDWGPEIELASEDQN